ncbi:MAG: SAM-dependent methyltransferase [Simkaniaceae bacterium]|nr:SAM-dependent methyltransferase [Candidatus Sacchlamyda saccharinae]
MSKKGKLLLLPNLLDKESNHEDYFPKSVGLAAQSLEGLIAENAKEGRAYLKMLGANYRDTPITLLNKHSQEIDELLAPLREGQVWGLISDAGLPILADPGYKLVHRARELAVIIEAFVGPSSLILALMLSGLPAQNFAFNGYLPHKPAEMLKTLEDRSRSERSTQIFIEVPYRNQRMLETLLSNLSGKTELSIAWDLTSPTQGVETHRVASWQKRSLPNLHKKPAVFLFNAT